MESEIGFLLLGVAPMFIVISVFYLVFGKKEGVWPNEN